MCFALLQAALNLSKGQEFTGTIGSFLFACRTHTRNCI
jgi:hypothetical protein